MSEQYNLLEAGEGQDPILAANAAWPAFQREHPDAINMTVGVLVDPDTMKPFRPDAVDEAYRRALHDVQSGHEYGYQSPAGNAAFLEAAGQFAFGSEIYGEHRGDMLAYQTHGGTGALSLAKETLSTLVRRDEEDMIPMVLDVGYVNHQAIFSEPFRVRGYEHKDQRTGAYNHQAAVEALTAAPDRAVFLLQTCGYNDDGADRTKEQWDEVLDIAQQKNAIVLLDSAYLGVANGLPADRYPLDQSVERGLFTLAAVSASKNMGLYGERLGALYIANAEEHLGKEQADLLDLNVKRTIRKSYTSVPLVAAKAATLALQVPEYYGELEAARRRLVQTRMALSTHLGNAAIGVAAGKGLFTKLYPDGFTPEQMAVLRSEGIHALPTSRINIGGMRLDQTERVGTVLAQVIALREIAS